MAINRLTLVKVAEFLLAIVIVVLHYKTYQASGSFDLFVTSATYGGFVIVVIGVFIGYITGNSINRHVDMFYCVVGAILYIYCGFNSYQQFSGWTFDESRANMGLTKGALSIIQGIVFIVDAFFVFKAE